MMFPRVTGVAGVACSGFCKAHRELAVFCSCNTSAANLGSRCFKLTGAATPAPPRRHAGVAQIYPGFTGLKHPQHLKHLQTVIAERSHHA